MAVADYFKDTYLKWFTRILNETNNWTEYVTRLTDDLQQMIDQGTYWGCPFSSFGTEIAVMNPEAAHICTAAINAYIDIFEQSLRNSGIPDCDARNRAVCALTMYEGFLVYYRIARAPQIITTMRDELIRSIQS